MSIDKSEPITVNNKQNSEIQEETKIEDKTTGLEINGPKGPEPTRYGDWEVNGRCSDF